MTLETRVVRKVAERIPCRISVTTYMKNTVQAIERAEIKMCVCVCVPLMPTSPFITYNEEINAFQVRYLK